MINRKQIAENLYKLSQSMTELAEEMRQVNRKDYKQHGRELAGAALQVESWSECILKEE